MARARSDAGTARRAAPAAADTAWRRASAADLRALHAWYVEPQPEPFFIEVAGPTPHFDEAGFRRYCRFEAALWVHAGPAGIDGFVLLTSIQTRMRAACLDWRCRRPPAGGTVQAGELASPLGLGRAIRTACARAGVHKAQALALADDAQRLALAEALGMRREGTLRSHFYHAGAYHDLIMLGWTPEQARD